MLTSKAAAVKLLIGVVVGLILFKMVVAWFTGSISIIAQATDSLLDLCAGIVTFATVRIAPNLPMKVTSLWTRQG